MALVVEDGSGIENADTWVALEDATQYWTDRQNAQWIAADDGQREAALRDAADYLATVFSWPGQPTTVGQRLPWPRAGVPSGFGSFPTDAIPAQVISAQMVLAIEALDTKLMLRPAAAGRSIIEETKSLKGMTKTVKYESGGGGTMSSLPRFPIVEQILSGIGEITTGGGGFRSIPMRRQL